MGMSWQCLYVFILINNIADVKGEEPACSQFHFVEQILEKLVRMEFDFERMLLDSKHAMTEMNKEVKQIKEERDTLKIELFNQTKALQNLEQRVRELNTSATVDFTSIPTISFLARQPTDDTPSIDQVIVYKTVLDNTGDGYDTITGTFTAPLNGLYSFSVHTCIYSKTYFAYSILRNGDDLVRGVNDAIGGGGSSYPCSSATVFTYLETGDKMWVKCTMSGSYTRLYSDSYRWNSFTGVLIHK